MSPQCKANRWMLVSLAAFAVVLCVCWAKFRPQEDVSGLATQDKSQSPPNTPLPGNSKSDAAQTQLMVTVGENFQGRVRNFQGDYESLVQALRNPPVMDASKITSRAELRKREELVRKFLRSTEQLREFSANPLKWFAEELDKQPLTAENRRLMEDGYRKEMGQPNSRVLAMRDADIKKAKAMLEVLSLLETNWGAWRYVTSGNGVEFSNLRLQSSYNRWSGEVKRLELEVQRMQSAAQQAYQSGPNDSAAK